MTQFNQLAAYQKDLNLRELPLVQIMTTDLISVLPTETMDKVNELFQTNAIHHIIVHDEHCNLKGIIGKEDLVRLFHNLTFIKREREEKFNQHFLSTVYVEEVMTKQVASLKETDTLGIAADIFRENLFHALPIVNEEEKVVGIVTTYDLLKLAY